MALLKSELEQQRTIFCPALFAMAVILSFINVLLILFYRKIRDAR